MPSDREKMETWTLGAVADSMAGAQPGTAAHTRGAAEILRRQTAIQEEAAEAQKRAAAATIDTANATRLSAKYMLWSVIVLAVACAARSWCRRGESNPHPA